MRREVGRFAAILGLTGIAIAGPVLDVFGDSPETFVFLRVDRAGIVGFALAVVAIPPLALWLAGLAVGLGGARARAAAHVATVGALVALVAVRVLGGMPAAIAFVGAAAIGAGAAVVYRRTEPVRLWVRLLAAYPLFALATFLVASPVSDLLSDPDVEPVAAATIDGSGPVEPPPSIVLIVLDELPLASLLGPDGRIDPVRYPNFAAFAAESTWYPDYTSLGAWTEIAVPPILTGRVPDNEPPLWPNHPDNLFRLFAGTHHLTVSESLTALCAPSLCQGTAVAPPPPSGTDADAVPVAAPAPAGPRTSELYREAFDVWRTIVDPTVERQQTFDDFAEPTIAVPPGGGPVASGVVAVPDDEFVTERDFPGWRALAPVQLSRFEEFVDAIGPTDEPTLFYLHLVLPHEPWRYRPDGVEYSLPGRAADLDIDRSHPWILDLLRQRHLLQLQYSDLLLGRTLDALRDAGHYDDTIVAVIADHGVSFELDTGTRSLDPGSVDDVVAVPFLVKAPGQTVGAIDGADLTSVDVLPTIAAMAGASIPWEVDGVDARSAAAPDEGPDKDVYRFQLGDFERLPDTVLRYAQQDITEGVLADPPAPIGPDDAPEVGLYADLAVRDLFATSIDDLGAASSSGVAHLDDLARLVDPDPVDPPLGVVTGWVDAPPDPDVTAVLAIDDRIVALSPLFDWRGQPGSFVMLLPGDALAPAGNQVRVALVAADGTATELTVERS